jgi:uncharacterized alkaline shock family protein YloU
MYNQLEKLDPKELDLPETVFVRDIETKVFQSIALHCLSHIQGIALVGGSLFDNLLGRDPAERFNGISVEQDQKACSIKVKVEINIAYGLSIPKKSEEIQLKLTEELSLLTGLHVASVHVIFKNLIFIPVESTLANTAASADIETDES